MAAVIFGLLYCGAIIQEGVKRSNLTKTELEYLHISIGLNHSVLEDPFLFMAMGINGLWLWIPKLIMAVFTVYLFRGSRYLWQKIKGNPDTSGNT